MADSARGPAPDGAGFHATFGVILARGVVPLYFALGAVLKLVDASATHLPPALIKLAGWMGLDLMYLFHLSIGVELAVAGAAVIMARLARPLGLLLLGIFLPILIAGVAMGSTSCGCFGAVSVPPMVTLVIDGLLFGLLWFFGGRAPSLAWKRELRTIPVVLAGLWGGGQFHGRLRRRRGLDRGRRDRRGRTGLGRRAARRGILPAGLLRLDRSTLVRCQDRWLDRG
jgi:hypothetical protein